MSLVGECYHKGKERYAREKKDSRKKGFLKNARRIRTSKQRNGRIEQKEKCPQGKLHLGKREKPFTEGLSTC